MFEKTNEQNVYSYTQILFKPKVTWQKRKPVRGAKETKKSPQQCSLWKATASGVQEQALNERRDASRSLSFLISYLFPPLSFLDFYRPTWISLSQIACMGWECFLLLADMGVFLIYTLLNVLVSPFTGSFAPQLFHDDFLMCLGID